MNTEVEGKRLRSMLESAKRDRRIENANEWLVDNVTQALESKVVTPDDFSLRDLFVNLVEDGQSRLYSWDRTRRRGGHIVTEAAHAVDAATFASISGQLVFSAVQDSMVQDEFIGDRLVSNFPSQFQNAELIPGITAASDEFAAEISEGDPYPLVGIQAEDITIPRAEKHGGILPITREAILADRTGVLIERARTVGRGLGLRKEKDILDVVIGGVNPYIRKGEARNTYANAGMGFDNLGVAQLIDFTDIRELAELFYAIREPNINEPLGFSPTTIVCGKNLSWQARAVIRDTQIREGDTTAAPSIQAVGPNRIPFNLAVLANEFFIDRLIANTTLGGLTSGNRALANAHWLLGNPKAAFLWKEIWALATEEAPSNNEEQFMRDIWFRIKVGYKGVPAVREPRLMIRSDGTA